MCIGGRNINAGGTTERSVIALLYCVADRLHGLSAGQILPIQAEVEKSYRLYPLCIIPDYSCRSILILSVSTAMISEISRMNDLLVTYLTNGAGNNVPQNLSEFIHENIDLQALNRILSEENILAAIKDTCPECGPCLRSRSISCSAFSPPLSYYYM